MSFRRPRHHTQKRSVSPLKLPQTTVTGTVQRTDSVPPVELINSGNVRERRPYGVTGVIQRQHLYLPGGEVLTQVGRSHSSVSQVSRQGSHAMIPNHPFGALHSVGDVNDVDDEVHDGEYDDTYVLEGTETQAEQ